MTVGRRVNRRSPGNTVPLSHPDGGLSLEAKLAFPISLGSEHTFAEWLPNQDLGEGCSPAFNRCPDGQGAEISLKRATAKVAVVPQMSHGP
jgi:hypothetical protein